LIEVVTFVELQGVKERGNLSMLPELALKTALPYVDNIEEFGHRVRAALIRVGYFFILLHSAWTPICLSQTVCWIETGEEMVSD